MANTCRFQQWIVIAASMLLLSACAETQLASHYAKKVTWPGQAEGKSTYKVGNPYKVAGTWYYPKEDFSLQETGIASWYGPDFHSKKTANGEIYNQHELTAAHRTLPMPSLVRVTNLENGRAIVVRINDRGPFLHGRIIDLSKRGAELLGFISQGTARVRVEVLANESRKIAAAAQRGMDTSRMTTEDLNRMSVSNVRTASMPQPSRAANVQTASMRNDATMLPDSLKTPTITVEELSSSGRPLPPRASPAGAPIQGHMRNGNFMPDPVVSKMPVNPTGLFVQAGAFGMRENAERMKSTLSGIAPVIVDPIQSGGKQLYRVRLGPFSTVAEADRALTKVIRAGNGSAKVIRH